MITFMQVLSIIIDLLNGFPISKIAVLVTAKTG